MGTPGGRRVLEEGRVAGAGSPRWRGRQGEVPLTSGVRCGMQEKCIRDWQGFWGCPGSHAQEEQIRAAVVDFT